MAAETAAAISRAFNQLWTDVVPPQTGQQQSDAAIFLRPRPFARFAGAFVLVPLLPKRPPAKALPAEVWRRIISIIVEEDSEEQRDVTSARPWMSGLRSGGQPDKGAQLAGHVRSVWNFAMVSKDFRDIALPLLYAHCSFRTLASLEKFTSHLYTSDQRWDSIRRIPYSTPGRWVLSINLSQLHLSTYADAYRIDALLTTLFPLLPFLTHLDLCVSFQLSGRAMHNLGTRDGAHRLRSLKGVKYDKYPFESDRTRLSGSSVNDPLTELVRNCPELEELEVVGSGLDDLDVMIADNVGVAREQLMASLSPSPLQLPRLHTLTLLSSPASDLLLRLLNTPLPALRNVVITPYGDIPPPLSLVTPFLASHGESIRTLVLHTPKSWPTVLYPPPNDLLHLLPNLTALSLEVSPRLALDPPPLLAHTSSASPPRTSTPSTRGHPLVSLWIPRPTTALREALLPLVPYLPNLREVRARETRWAKKGMSAKALEAGFQGEMRAWRRLLAHYKVKMLDADGREGSA